MKLEYEGKEAMNLKKWISAGVLAMLIGTGTAALTVQAEAYDREEMVVAEEREEAAAAATTKVSTKAWKRINGISYNGSGVAISPQSVTRGIDVSEWQGTIDWAKVKKSDVDFAFVRISYGTGYLDKKYAYNMKQAEAAGVPVGTYVYSLATTTTQALKEAQLAIQQMQGYKVSYPVVFDLEYSKMGALSKQKIAQLAKTFCDEVKKAGYYPMVYCNANWYKEKVDWSLLQGIDVWIAQYGDKIQAPSRSSYNYTIWQCTDGDGGGVLNSTKGLISGIPSGNNTDLDFGYVDYTKKITPRRNSLATYKPTSSTTTAVKNGWVTEGGKTYYYVNGKKATGWKKIGGKYYYFNSKQGYIYKNKLLTSSKNKICYMDANGARVTKQWVDYGGKRYYMGANGYAVKGFYKIKGKYYFFHKTKGYMYKSRRILTKAGNIYYVGSDGARYSNGFYTVTENGRKYTYYFAKNGRAYKGWHTIKGKRYFFYRGTGKLAGVRVENKSLSDKKGLVSVFNKNGVCTKQYYKKK